MNRAQVLGTEEALSFPCEGESLMGILHRPAAGTSPSSGQVGILVVVGGPQYRAGSHRHFVHLARTLAAAGHVVMRFDVRGMGDSTGEFPGFEGITADIGAAVDRMIQEAPTVKSVVLWGLCDGASASLLYVHARRDTRVSGLCLLNPWVRSEAGQARTRVKHYYTSRIAQKEFWVKLVRGGVSTSAVGELARTFVRAARRPLNQRPSGAIQSYQDKMLAGWQSFAGPTLLVLSSDDYTAREFEDLAKTEDSWRHATAKPGVTRLVVPGADHTFSDTPTKQNLDGIMTQWLQRSIRG